VPNLLHPEKKPNNFIIISQMWQRLFITKIALILLVVPIVSYID
jgi:hypothetical protein